MRDLSRDVIRLELIKDDVLGLEAISLLTKVSDLVRYFFVRFLDNVKHSSKPFLHSEITAFNGRYQGQMAHIVSNPKVNLKTLIVPIPKGMQDTYEGTLDTLLTIVRDTHPETIVSDLVSLVRGLETGDIHQSNQMASVAFNRHKQTIGNAFAKIGLTHRVFDKAFSTTDSVGGFNRDLMEATKVYYPLVIAIDHAIPELERAHANATVDEQHRQIITQALMSLAYRITVFSSALDHIQAMEHSFVRVLALLKSKA